MLNLEDKLNDRIALLRKKRNMTQSDLAKKAGISTVSVSNYEQGIRAPSSKTLASIAQALHAPSWLLTDGLPSDADLYYDYDFFLNASDSDMQEYYVNKRIEANDSFFSSIHEEADFIKTYVNDLTQLELYSDLNQLGSSIRHEKNSIINREAINRIKKNPNLNTIKAVSFDIFEDKHEKDKLALQKNYRFWFATETTTQLSELIKGLQNSDNVSSDELITKLESIREIAYKEIQRNTL